MSYINEAASTQFSHNWQLIYIFVCLFVFFLPFIYLFLPLLLLLFLSFFLLSHYLPLYFLLNFIFISIVSFINFLCFISAVFSPHLSSLLPFFPCGWLVTVQSRSSRSVLCGRQACREVNNWVDQMHILLIHLLWGFIYQTTTYACTGKIQGSTIVPVRTSVF